MGIKSEDEKMVGEIADFMMDETLKQAHKNLFDPNWKGWCDTCNGLHRTENCPLATNSNK